MKEELKKQIKFVPIDKASAPKSGMFEVYKDYWWVVTPDEEIMFYREHSPQCNRDEAIAKRVHEKLYPGYEVRQLPLVFVPINPRDY